MLTETAVDIKHHKADLSLKKATESNRSSNIFKECRQFSLKSSKTEMVEFAFMILCIAHTIFSVYVISRRADART